MNFFFKQVVINAVLSGTDKNKAISSFRLAKKFRDLKIDSLRLVKDIFFIGIGIASAAFGLEGFLLPNKFVDGGATGISLLIAEKSNLPLSVWLLIVNLPFILIGYKTIGKGFAIKAALAIAGLALCVAFIKFPQITSDKLLVAVFGGFFLGAGIGFAVRGGSVLDGTEVLAIYISRKSGATIGDVILIFNLLIFSVAAYLLSIEQALYSMITYLAASKTIDFIVEGIEEYTGITIISVHADEIREMIVHQIGRGVTVYIGKRGHGNHGERKDIDIVYTIITRLEISKLKTEIEKIDPNAFMVMSSVKDIKGGMIKKRALH